MLIYKHSPSMDLDANRHNIDELVDVLLLPMQDSYTPTQLRIATLNKLKATMQIDDDTTNGQQAKDQLADFFIKAVLRVAKAYGVTIPTRTLSEFNAIRHGLLPPMVENTVFKQGSHLIINHDNERPLETHITPLAEGTLNPLKRTVIKRLLNINTRFREDYKHTRSTDFTFTLPYPIKNVTSLDLISIEFPNSLYPFSSNLCTSSFTIITYDVNDMSNSTIRSDITVPNGNYSATELVNYLNNYFIDHPPLDRVRTSYNSNTGKFSFILNHGVAETKLFDLDFTCQSSSPLSKYSCLVTGGDTSSSHQLTMGWMLGFRHPHYHFRDKNTPLSYHLTPTAVHDIGYVGEGTFDGQGTRYFLLSVDDYSSGHSSGIISSFADGSLVNDDILAKIPSITSLSRVDFSPCCHHTPRVYFGPTNLARFRIRVFDEYGRIIDVNRMDYSLSFELEILYDL